MTVREHEVGLADFSTLRGTSGDVLRVVDHGRLEHADCTDLKWRHISLLGEQSYVRSAVAALTRGVRGPEFAGCDFSGMRVAGLFPWSSRFVDCAFDRVDVKLGLGTMYNDVVGCRFTGRWDGNFGSRDGRRRHRVEGNDFRGLRGADFHGGVDWRTNQFDIGGEHLILTSQAAGSSAVRRLAVGVPMLGRSVAGVLSEGSPYHRQGWALLNREFLEEEGGPALWIELVRLLG